MPATVAEEARELFEQRGRRAVYIAIERLNQSIDRGDGIGRDFWAQVVHAIHEHQGSIKRKRLVRSKAQKVAQSHGACSETKGAPS